MMRFNRENLSVLRCASRDKHRAGLHSLHVEQDGTTVATDGHVLAYCLPSDETGKPDQPVTLDAECLTETRKRQKRKSGPPVIPAALETDPASGKLSICDPEAGGTFVAREADATFPDWKMIVPKGEATFTVGLSTEVLLSIVETFLEHEGKTRTGTSYLRFEFTDDRSAFRVRSATGRHSDSERLHIVAMPTRL